MEGRCCWQPQQSSNVCSLVRLSFNRADVLRSAGQKPSLSLFTPEDLRRAEEAGELDADANLFNLRPDPTQFVRYLKSIGRSDISSEIFVRLLEAYREVKAQAESDPLRYARPLRK